MSSTGTEISRCRPENRRYRTARKAKGRNLRRPTSRNTVTIIAPKYATGVAYSGKTSATLDRISRYEIPISASAVITWAR
jgi:hypothetical protein